VSRVRGRGPRRQRAEAAAARVGDSLSLTGDWLTLWLSTRVMGARRPRPAPPARSSPAWGPGVHSIPPLKADPNSGIYYHVFKNVVAFGWEVAMQLHPLFTLTLGLLIATDARDDATKKDLEKFQGNWQLISAERDGKKTPQVEAKKITLTIQGNKFVLRKDAVIISEGTMTLDLTKKPKEIDETITTGPNKGKTFSAIYEIDDEHHNFLPVR
jgi:uncharacterized protein (TIGR03067 family)